jgi:hypothetical protein
MRGNDTDGDGECSNGSSKVAELILRLTLYEILGMLYAHLVIAWVKLLGELSQRGDRVHARSRMPSGQSEVYHDDRAKDVPS